MMDNGIRPFKGVGFVSLTVMCFERSRFLYMYMKTAGIENVVCFEICLFCCVILILPCGKHVYDKRRLWMGFWGGGGKDLSEKKRSISQIGPQWQNGRLF